MMKSLKLFAASFIAFVTVLFLGAYCELLCEEGRAGADIKTYGDALWWALNICSVGDASFSPVSPAGRVVGAVLILVGYACFTVNVAVITTVLNKLIHKGGVE